MPIPLAILIAAAATGASTIANTVAQRKVNDARNNAQDDFYRRQREQSAKARDAAARFEANATSVPEQARVTEADYRARLGDAMAANEQGVTPTSLVEVDNQSQVTLDEGARKGGQERAFTNRLADALSIGRGMDLATINSNIAQRENARDIQRAGSFQLGDAAVLDTKLNAANYEGGGWRAFADIAQAVAQAAMLKGMLSPAAGGVSPTAPISPGGPMPQPIPSPGGGLPGLPRLPGLPQTRVA